jgi:hypothetical protein
VSVRGNRDGGAPDRAGVGDDQGRLAPQSGAPPCGGAPARQPVPRYRLHGALEMFAARDGDVYLLRGGSGPEHIVRSPDPADRALLRELAANGVVIGPGSEAGRRVAPLIAAGAVVRGQTSQRFPRPMPNGSGDSSRISRTSAIPSPHNDVCETARSRYSAAAAWEPGRSPRWPARASDTSS